MKPITFTNRKKTEKLSYKSQPVINIIRVVLNTQEPNWVSQFSNTLLVIKIYSLGNTDEVLSTSEEVVSLGGLISPHHTKPVIELNKTIVFGNDRLTNRHRNSTNWQIEITLSNLSMGKQDSFTVEYLDSNEIIKRVNDWEKRLVGLFNQVEEWLKDTTTYSLKILNKESMNEGMMQTFNVAPALIPSAEIIKNGKVIAILKPIALWIIAANGRIDFLSADKNYIIIDTAKAFDEPIWKIALNSSKTQIEFLNKPLFLKIIES